MTKKISFTGNFFQYFVMQLGLLVLSIITLGIALPYWFYWSLKYFFTNLEINNSPLIYSGGFFEYFLMSIGLLVLSIITLGLAFPYYIYWSFKYFFTKLEIQI